MIFVGEGYYPSLYLSKTSLYRYVREAYYASPTKMHQCRSRVSDGLQRTTKALPVGRCAIVIKWF